MLSGISLELITVNKTVTDIKRADVSDGLSGTNFQENVVKSMFISLTSVNGIAHVIHRMQFHNPLLDGQE